MRTVGVVTLAFALAACSAPLTAVTPAASTPSFADAIHPNAVCPVVGKTFRRGKSSSVLASRIALPGLSASISWKVVFTNIASPNAPVEFVPQLVKCGPSPGNTPLGTVRDTGGGSTESRCHNGSCIVTVTYTVRYSAPATLPRRQPWKFDLLRFVPSRPKAPYGPLPGTRIEVRAPA